MPPRAPHETAQPDRASRRSRGRHSAARSRGLTAGRRLRLRCPATPARHHHRPRHHRPPASKGSRCSSAAGNAPWLGVNRTFPVPSWRSSAVIRWRRVRISASLSRSPIGSRRSVANAFTTPRQVSRSSTIDHHAASIASRVRMPTRAASVDIRGTPHTPRPVSVSAALGPRGHLTRPDPGALPDQAPVFAGLPGADRCEAHWKQRRVRLADRRQRTGRIADHSGGGHALSSGRRCRARVPPCRRRRRRRRRR